MAAQRQFCTFYVGGLYLGIEVKAVQEVIRYQDMTAVPLAAPEVGGLINLRGQIVTAIDLRQRLSLDCRPNNALPMNVVVRADGGSVSFLVDEIGDVVDVSDDLHELPPETLRGDARPLITGVYKLKNKLLLALDTAKALDIDAISKS